MKLSEEFIDNVWRTGIEHMDLIRDPAMDVLGSIDIHNSGTGGVVVEADGFVVVIGRDGSLEYHEI